MIFGVVGDVHGDFDALRRAMERHTDAGFWLSVGDVAANDLRYPEPIAPFYWIQGNNEDFAFIARVVRAPYGDDRPNLHFLPNGSCSVIRGLSVGALGGTFAPTWYDTPAADLPFPGAGGPPRLARGAPRARSSAGPGVPATQEKASLAGCRGPRHRHPSAAAALGVPPSKGDEAERALRGSGVGRRGPHERPSLAGPGVPAIQVTACWAGCRGPRHRHPSAAAALGAPPSKGDEAERGVGAPRARSLAGCRGPRHSRDDKRRHFVREQVDALKATAGVDVLLTHEAPRPFIVQAGPRRLDAGKTVINELLAAMRPRLHFFGHHHRYSDAIRGAVRSIGLDLVSQSYVLVDGDSFEVTKVEAGG